MLVKKIKQYLEKNSIQDLYYRTGVSPTVFYSLLKRDWKKYNKNILDILYEFFNIEKDNFYKENLKKWYSKTPSLFGTFIRYKRLQEQISIDELARKIMMEKRALLRIESGDALPGYNSWTVEHLIKELNFNKEEQIQTRMYIDNMKWIERQIKQLEKDIE